MNATKDAKRQQGPSPPSCIYDLIAARAEVSPDAPAVLAPERADLSYRGLLDQVQRVVQSLNALGVGRKDRVAVVLPNGAQMAVAFLTVAAGATCAPLNPGYRAPEFEFYLSDLQARALILRAGAHSPAREVAQSCGIPVIELSTGPTTKAGAFTLAGDVGAGPALPGFAGPEDTALMLHTSGTTSQPKIVPLTHANLCASAHNIMASLELQPADRCLNVMPLFHIHGLTAAVLASLAAGGSVVCTPGFDAQRFFEWLRKFGPTWFTAAPTMHQAILSHAVSRAEDAGKNLLRFIRSCSSALPPQVMAELESTFRAPVIEAYGMTEAAHQVASNPLPPRERKPGTVGIAAGPEVAIMDDAGNLLKSGETGEIVIRGANVTRGYENNPEANQSAFTHGWFRTGDQGVLNSDGYLRITGRIKEIINRGGEKVSPREVDEALMEHAAVAQAVTYAVPHPRLGEDVVAAVVLKDNASATGEEIRHFAAGRLADHKVPRRVLIVSEIPTGPTGKLRRIGLSERLGHLLRTEFLAPRNPVEKALADIWAELLATDRVGVNEDFFLAGGGSLLAAEMLVRVSEAFPVEIPLGEFFERPTVAHLGAIIQQLTVSGAGAVPVHNTPSTAASTVMPVQPRGERPPFFMVSWGLSWDMRDMAKHLGADQPLYSVRPSALLGLPDEGPVARSIASRHVEAIRAVRPHGPYVLGGGCSAGIVAFEMAQQLVAAGESVPLVVLFDVDYPPSRFLPIPLGVRLLRAPRTWRQLRRMTGPERLARIRRRARIWKDGVLARLMPRRKGPLRAMRHRLRPEEADIYLERVLAPIIDAVWDYAPKPYPGRMALFLATDTAIWFHRDRRLDWRRVASGEVEVVIISGEHQRALLEPHARCAAGKLKACIDQALRAQA